MTKIPVVLSKLFEKLNHVNIALYEIELTKAEIEHKKPIIVGYFILQNAKLSLLKLYYNFFTKYCDVKNFEELKMDTDSLYNAVAEKELEGCIRPEMKAKWDCLRLKDCTDSLVADAVANFFLRKCSDKHKKQDKREPGLFNEEFRCTEMLILCSKIFAAMMLPQTYLNSVIKV